MNTANIQALARFRMEQANQALNAAELLRQAESCREALNRAYYAMFYAVLALLAVEKKETSKHKGVISLFDLQYVKTGVFSKEFSEWLHEAFSLRLDADYVPLYYPPIEDTDRVLQNARKFVAGIKIQLSSFLAD